MRLTSQKHCCRILFAKLQTILYDQISNIAGSAETPGRGMVINSLETQGRCVVINKSCRLLSMYGTIIRAPSLPCQVTVAQ